MAETGEIDATVPHVLGREEWLALPELSIPAIKAKIDTGARTSALHAFDIAPFGPAERPMVRFSVHPVRGRDDITVHCTAPVLDRREVASSNGERELRYVIRTAIRIGDRQWPVEITLTDRSTMTSRMLLGRSALRASTLVDPSSTFRQPRLSYRVYRGTPRHRTPDRTLALALLTDGPPRHAGRLIAEEATRRGHAIERLDLHHMSLTLDGTSAGLLHHARALDRFDAVLPLFGRAAGRFGLAVLGQFELMGAVSLNPAASFATCRDRVMLAQHLAGRGLPVAPVILAAPGDAVPKRALTGARDEPGVRIVVAAGRAYAIPPDPAIAAAAERSAGPAHIDLARRAARVLGLELCEVELTAGTQRPAILGVTTRPALARLEPAAARRAAAALIHRIETRAPVQRRGS